MCIAVTENGITGNTISVVIFGGTGCGKIKITFPDPASLFAVEFAEAALFLELHGLLFGQNPFALVDLRHSRFLYLAAFFVAVGRGLTGRIDGLVGIYVRLFGLDAAEGGLVDWGEGGLGLTDVIFDGVDARLGLRAGFDCFGKFVFESVAHIVAPDSSCKPFPIRPHTFMGTCLSASPTPRLQTPSTR